MPAGRHIGVHGAWWPQRPYEEVPDDQEARSRAATIRRAALGDACADEPLLSLDVLCRAAGVSVGALDLHVGGDAPEALLTPQRVNRFTIHIDPAPVDGWPPLSSAGLKALRRHRVRFRIAHELAHTFFYWRDRERPRRCLQDSPAQERFCDCFAAELLLPRTVAANCRAAAAAVVALQHRYDVSLQFAARAVAEAKPDVAMSLWRTGHKGETLQWGHGDVQRCSSQVVLAERGQRLQVFAAV